MKISELQAKQGNVEIQAEIVDISPVREFQKFGKTGRVANATIKDGSGQVTMTLWNEQIDTVKVGDKIEIKDGYVNEWQGDLQVTTGRNGTLNIL
ncbi:MAG: SOSS complex subunit B family protein [archaeon]